MLRRGRPLLRTAAVVGTATAVSGRVQHRQQERYSQQEAEQYAEQAPPPAAPSQGDNLAELEQLAKLHEQGVLTDDEFAAKKAQILGI